MNTNMVSYYRDRAQEYEKVYSKPERQADLKRATEILQAFFAGKSVLEIACGTGYWTERIAATATSIFATDINKTVIDVARRKTFSPAEVNFGLADIYNLPTGIKYETLFGGFIWSHIMLQDIDGFLQAVNKSVAPGGTVVFMDNNFVEGNNHPITNTDAEGNTFQTRKLDDGSVHQVLKNFPDEEFLRSRLEGKANNISVINLSYYWILSYTIPKGDWFLD